MKRFTLAHDYMQMDKTGKWVEYEEAQAEIEDLNERIAELERMLAIYIDDENERQRGKDWAAANMGGEMNWRTDAAIPE